MDTFKILSEKSIRYRYLIRSAKFYFNFQDKKKSLLVYVIFGMKIQISKRHFQMQYLLFGRFVKGSKKGFRFQIDWQQRLHLSTYSHPTELSKKK